MGWSDFGLNIGVEFIGLAVGVPITIYVIDLLIKRREEKRWKDSKSLIKKDILNVTTATLMSIRCALGISWRDALQISSRSKVSDKEIEKSVTQFGQKLIRNFEDSLKETLLQMAPSTWNTLFINFEGLDNSINNIFSAYAGFLEPELAKHLILVRNKLLGIKDIRYTLPEAFNDTFENIRSDTVLVETRKTAVNEIHRLIINVLELRSSVEKLQ